MATKPKQPQKDKQPEKKDQQPAKEEEKKDENAEDVFIPPEPEYIYPSDHNEKEFVDSSVSAKALEF